MKCKMCGAELPPFIQECPECGYLHSQKELDEEAKRLALQDQPRLDAEIEAWAAGISSEELERWVSEDLAMWRSSKRGTSISMEELAKEMIEEFDNAIGWYDPMAILSTVIAGADPPDAIDVKTRGAKFAMEVMFSSPLLSAAYNEEEMEGDFDSLEFKRECYNEIYLVDGRLRKMKELYKKVIEKSPFSLAFLDHIYQFRVRESEDNRVVKKKKKRRRY